MNCPFCGHTDSKVIDSRDSEGGIRRRRECLKCHGRFTTYERPQRPSLFVIKKDRRREEFNKDKLLSGIRKACEKRPLESNAVDRLADDIETELYQQGKTEIPTSVIGDMVMEKLKALDYIAYIRFASVYREFKDVTDFKREVDNLVESTEPGKERASQLPLIPGSAGDKTDKSRVRGRRVKTATVRK
jgi:transcriptional repressor NrdR